MQLNGVLCTFLALMCHIQLIILFASLVLIPQFLKLTGTKVSTTFGIFAAFVAAITSQLIKTVHRYPNEDNKIYSYLMQSRRIALSLSIVLHFAALIATLVSIIKTVNFRKEFLRLMVKYYSDLAVKPLVDDIQFAFQCCGAVNYTDWLLLYRVLSEKTNNIKFTLITENNEIPFSCCSRTTVASCIHQNVEVLGDHTLNHKGCGKRLRIATMLYLCFQIFLYTASLVLEVSIILLLTKPSTPPAPTSSKKSSTVTTFLMKSSNDSVTHDDKTSKTKTVTSKSSKASARSKASGKLLRSASSTESFSESKDTTTSKTSEKTSGPSTLVITSGPSLKTKQVSTPYLYESDEEEPVETVYTNTKSSDPSDVEE